MESNQRNIYQRLIEVQKRVLSVTKNEKVSTGGEGGYKAVSHDDVAALLHLPLAECGVFLLPNVEKYSFSEFEVDKKTYKQKWYRTDIEISAKWINVDKPDDFIESKGAAYALDTSDKSFAKAYSMALKIILLKVHLLESRDGEELRMFESEPTPTPQKERTRPATDKKAGGVDQVPSILSQAQLKRLFAIGKANFWEPEDIKKTMRELFNKESSKELNQVDYDILINYLEKNPMIGNEAGVSAPKPEEKKDEGFTQTPPTEPPTPPHNTPKPAEPPKPSTLTTPPAEYLIESSELFADLNGKRICEIDPQDLGAFHKFLADECKKNPPPKRMMKLLEMKRKIERYQANPMSGGEP